MKKEQHKLVPVFFVFVIITVIIFISAALLQRYSISRNLLLGANVFLLLINLLAYSMQKRSLRNSNPNAFVRSVIAGMMLKMFSVVIAVLIYVVSAGVTYDKKGIFISLFIYLIYLGAEVAAISRDLRIKNVKKGS